MNPQEQLQFLIQNGRTWVQAQRDRHRPEAAVLSTAVKAHFAPFFEPHILNSARFKWVDLIENPDFYAELAAMGIHAPLDFTTMAGITFLDTILISEREHPRNTPHGPLLFHELVHVIQYSLLGRDAFIERYVLGWAESGQNYDAIPLEQDAYTLQAWYEKQPDQAFCVEAEVRRCLGLP